MSGLILAVLLGAAVLLAVGWPLFARPPQALGRGLEDDAPVVRWEAERARLIAAMRDNDLALAEGRLDTATHQATAARLSAEAEAVLKRLRAARGQFEPPPEAAAARPQRLASALGLALVLLAALGIARMASWQDLDLAVNPHENGNIPLDESQLAAGPPAEGPPAGAPVIAGPPVGIPPLDADGAPDVGAMVGRLEARVAQGDASADEVKMLLRSYDTLGRMADARQVLEAALPRFPDDTELQLAWLRAVISLPREGDADRALPVADSLIAAMPDLLEARWYRALLLVQEGRRDEARAELSWMHPQLPPESAVERAVAQLIARLSDPPG